LVVVLRRTSVDAALPVPQLSVPFDNEALLRAIERARRGASG
jgi:hypothetical protein